MLLMLRRSSDRSLRENCGGDRGQESDGDHRDPTPLHLSRRARGPQSFTDVLCCFAPLGRRRRARRRRRHRRRLGDERVAAGTAEAEEAFGLMDFIPVGPRGVGGGGGGQKSRERFVGRIT